MVHKGLERMEEATWTIPPIEFPKLGREAHRALWWRMLIFLLSCLTIALLGIFARPPIGTYPKPHVRFEVVTDTTGQPVARAQWIERAQAHMQVMEYCQANPNVNGCER